MPKRLTISFEVDIINVTKTKYGGTKNEGYKTVDHRRRA